jgi:hypothetical protein
MGWIQERLEWAVDNMLNEGSECVLVLAIDPAEDVVASLEELREPPELSKDDLVLENGFIIGVQVKGEALQGIVWCERNGVLYVSADHLRTATGTLAYDLAQTLTLPVNLKPQSLEDVARCSLFLISDEFGFLPIENPDATSTFATEKLQDCFAKLW